MDWPFVVDEGELGRVGRRVDPDALAAAAAEVDHGRLADEQLGVVGARVGEVGVARDILGPIARGT